MVSSDFRGAIAAYIRENARPVDKYGHQPRLYALALEVGAGQAYDDDVVYAAAWLHDLGVFVGHRPEDPEALKRWDHVGYALERVPGILEAAGFPGEQLGAVGVLRAVAKVGRDTRFLTFTDAVGALRRALERLPAEIRLETTRRLAAGKLEVLRGFLDAVEREGVPGLF